MLQPRRLGRQTRGEGSLTDTEKRQAAQEKLSELRRQLLSLQNELSLLAAEIYRVIDSLDDD